MTHSYSVEVHNYISEQIAIAEEKNKKVQKQNDFETQRFYQGQLKELCKIREYLTEKIDLKTQKYY
ncbi:MAG: hypothetical protein JRJ46_10895 [Deltaproteobacteria bacterium]|nr:hypothetical protein [Deltaproteobacteria bacterium]